MPNKPSATPSASPIQEQLVPIAEIIRTNAMMMRVELNQTTIEQYAEAMKTGAVFPPVEITQAGQHKYLTGGWHRVAAAEMNRDTTILARVRLGTVEEAIVAAARDGAHQGLARSNDDKRLTVERLLAIDWGKENSDPVVAAAAGVSHTFVANVRREKETENGSPSDPTSTCNGCKLNASDPSALPPAKRKGKDGRFRATKRKPKGGGNTLPGAIPPMGGQTTIPVEQRLAEFAAEEAANEETEVEASKPAVEETEVAPISSPMPTLDPAPSPTVAPTAIKSNNKSCDSTGANLQQLKVSLERAATQLAYVASKYTAPEVAALVVADPLLREPFARIAPGWLVELATAIGGHGPTFH